MAVFMAVVTAVLRCSVFAVARHLMNVVRRRDTTCIHHASTTAVPQHLILQILNQLSPIHGWRQEVPLLNRRVAILDGDDVTEGAVPPVVVELVQDFDLLLVTENVDGRNERHRRNTHVLQDEDAAQTEPAAVPRVDTHAEDTLQQRIDLVYFIIPHLFIYLTACSII